MERYAQPLLFIQLRVTLLTGPVRSNGIRTFLASLSEGEGVSRQL